MAWDYTEANPFSDSSGNWSLGVEQAAKSVAATPATGVGHVFQADARQPKDPKVPWMPEEAPEKVVRIVTENARTLKFTAQGFEPE